MAWVVGNVWDWGKIVKESLPDTVLKIYWTARDVPEASGKHAGWNIVYIACGTLTSTFS